MSKALSATPDTTNIVGLCVIAFLFGLAEWKSICLSDTEINLLITASACVITTFLIFMCCFCHKPTEDALRTSVFVLVYHCVAFIMYFTSSISLLVWIHVDKKHGSRYYYLLVASILAFVNAILYLVSIIYSNRAFKNKGGGGE